MKSRGLRTALPGVLLGIAASAGVAADRTLPLEMSVKVLPSPAVAKPAMEMRTGRRPVPGPTTPGARSPQYQLGHKQRQIEAVEESSNPHVRFLLSLPRKQLLVEATITIDGLPYKMIREKRVARILERVQLPKEDSLETAARVDSKEPVETPAMVLPVEAALERLRRSVAVTGEEPTFEEAHWILSNWVEGPTLLRLNENFQRFRANQRPAFVILDRNRDGTVSAEELQMAVASLQECDLNRDDIVQFTEIAAAAADPRKPPVEVQPGSLITVLDPDTANHDHQRLTSQSAPDLKLIVNFDTAKPSASLISVTEVAPEHADAVTSAMIDANGISLTVAGTQVYFIAVQGDASDQISFGAVVDGYPLLPDIDPNDDGRLTIRELRKLNQFLKPFDKNQDGALSIDEVESPIRVCIGLGATVHRELAGIRSAHPKESVPSVVGPEWFVRMDRNKDNDLTRGEFPGADDQFQALDADNDQLISAGEALEFDRKSGNTNKTDDQSDATSAMPDSTTETEKKP